MKLWKRSTSVLLAATLLVGLLALLPSHSLLAKAPASTPEVTATATPTPSSLPDVTVKAGPSGAEDWLSTPAAQIRDSQGACAQGYECLELCRAGEPTGQFQCWPKNSW